LINSGLHCNTISFFGCHMMNLQTIEGDDNSLEMKQFLEFHLTLDIIRRRKTKTWRITRNYFTRDNKARLKIFGPSAKEESCNRSGMIYCYCRFFLISSSNQVVLNGSESCFADKQRIRYSFPTISSSYFTCLCKKAKEREKELCKRFLYFRAF